MSESQRRRHATGELKEKHAARMRARWASPDYKARVGAAISEAHARPDVQKKLRAPRVLTQRTRELLRDAANRRWNKVREG